MRKRITYKELYIGPGAKRPNGCVLEHRYIAEQQLGRPLRNQEVVHHLDGDSHNNKPDNLVVFRSGADHSRAHASGIIEKHDDGTCTSPVILRRAHVRPCKMCGKDCMGNKSMCAACSHFSKRKVKRPTKEELYSMIWRESATTIAQRLGVSDSALSKWCKQYGISKPGRGYWAKVYSNKI